MRRLFITIFAVAALVSCEKTELQENSPNQGDAIHFGRMSTKAQVQSDNDLLEFGVCAEMNMGNTNSAALEWSPILENERVWRVDASNWTYTNTSYWIDGHTFSFFGFHPYTNGVIRRSNDIIDASVKIGTSISYTVPINIPYAADDDFMTAYTTELANKQSYPESVNMTFAHKLSKIDFKIKSDEPLHSYVIKEIGFTGISRTGSLNAVCTLGASKSYSETISSTPENRRVTRTGLSVVVNNVDTAVEVLNTEDSQGNVIDGGLLVIPQDIVEGQAKLTIGYTYTQKDNNGNITDTRDLTLEIDIPTSTISRWESGKSYTYTLTLQVDDNVYISTPMVEAWGSPQSGGIVIIK